MSAGFSASELAAISQARVLVLAPRSRILRRIDRAARKVAVMVERMRRAHAAWFARVTAERPIFRLIGHGLHFSQTWRGIMEPAEIEVVRDRTYGRARGDVQTTARVVDVLFLGNGS